MTADPSTFISTTYLSFVPVIHIANGSHMNVTHTGSISTSTISLSDVYYIPALTHNLVAIGQLCELRLTIISFCLWLFGIGPSNETGAWDTQ